MTENNDEKPTFSSRLKQKRTGKDRLRYFPASRAGRANSNLSDVEKPFVPRPALDMVEALARALDWDINEARRMAGYPEVEDNLTPGGAGPVPVESQVPDPVSKCGQQTDIEIPEIELDDLDGLDDEEDEEEE